MAVGGNSVSWSRKGRPVTEERTSPQNTEERASLSGMSFIRKTPA